MLNGKEAPILINRRTALLECLLFAAVLAFLPISSRAQCSTQWGAGGEWQINQHGQKFPLIKLRIQQNGGNTLTGTANQTIVTKTQTSGSFGEHGDITGQVDGSIVGDTFSINIRWNNNTTGVYKGIILPSGNIDGRAWEIRSPNVLHTWNSMQRMRCMPAVEPKVVTPSVEPPKPKPLKAGGRKVNSEVPPMKVPGIVVSQVLYPFVGSPQGTLVLTWDGGPDHPYAEVWVKVNNGEDTFLIEKGKGFMSVPVERHKSYVFILTDGGKTLSTVSFVVP